MERLLDLLLGTEPRQRQWLLGFVAVAGVYVFSAVLALYGAWAGLTERGPSIFLSVFNVAGVLGFYAALRSGWSHRTGDPRLAVAQMLFGMASVTLAYQVAPAVRGSISMLMALVLVYGAFTLPPQRCRALAWLSVAINGAGMLAGALRAPQLFDPRIEVVHFLLCLVVLPLVGHLAGQLSALRAEQRLAKAELRAALDKVQLLATHDELTGLPNRRQVLELLALEERRAQRQPLPLCIALLDIDHFKQINDSLGHQAGDEALRLFTHVLQGGLRAGDVLARWGGEEFILLLPSTALEEAARVVERLRLRCADASNWQAQPRLQVSFSAGLSAQVPGEPTQLAIARADAALYQAKHAGRDRVEVA